MIQNTTRSVKVFLIWVWTLFGGLGCWLLQSQGIWMMPLVTEIHRLLVCKQSENSAQQGKISIQLCGLVTLQMDASVLRKFALSILCWLRTNWKKSHTIFFPLYWQYIPQFQVLCFFMVNTSLRACHVLDNALGPQDMEINKADKVLVPLAYTGREKWTRKPNTFIISRSLMRITTRMKQGNEVVWHVSEMRGGSLDSKGSPCGGIYLGD